MLRKLVLATALAASSMAFAQQNVDISGANLSSGNADATLAALGRKAAQSGNRLIVTAPPEWHAKIAAKIQAGGNANVVMRDGFYENVLVRVEPKGEAAVEPERAVEKAEVEKIKAQAEKAKADAEKSRAEADKAKSEAEIARAQAETAKAQADAARHQAQIAAATPTPAPAAPVVAARVTAQGSPADEDKVDAAHARLAKALNGGRAADGILSVANLQAGDTLYVDGPVRAATRREGGHIALYWVEGDLDLRRNELKVVAPERYQVISSIRGEGTLRRDAAGAVVLDAREPAADAPSRLSLEKSLNDGRTITSTMTPERLRSGDFVYINANNAVVVRRNDSDLARYWLIGSLDLTQVGLRADGANKYKVVSDTVR